MSRYVKIGSSLASPDPDWLWRVNNPEFGPKIMTNEFIARLTGDFPEDVVKKLISLALEKNYAPIQIPFDRWDLLPPPSLEDLIQ